GLREELHIDEHDVGDVAFRMVALQSRHLNTALLGVARVNEPCEQLARRVLAGECHDFNNARSVPLSSAYDLFDDPCSDGSWHATARLRLHVAIALHDPA
ncbi:MAG TPA: hypothetical protein VHW23_24245, partial [Kofleriaceae bacterium]|nr:hypothetical protein [Kofleriaceae bacterium]